MTLKDKIINFEIRAWVDMKPYEREAYRKELFGLLREAEWYICDAEATLYTLGDMNKHMEKAQTLIRKRDFYDWSE